MRFTPKSLLGLCAFVVFACAKQAPPPRSQPSELLDQRIPHFETQTLSEKPLTSDSFDDHPVVLAFVKTECPRCEQTLGVVKEVFEYDERAVTWAIFAPEDPKKIKRVAIQHGLEFPVVLDGAERLQSLFMVTKHPTIVVLDTLGRVRWVGDTVTAEELEQIVRDNTLNPLTNPD